MTLASPWTLRFYDGSGNGYYFVKDEKDSAASFEYDPITPEQSSSGHYSGGTPVKGSLDSDQCQKLWDWTRLFQNDESLQNDQRLKGTGWFKLDIAGEKADFTADRGAKLEEFMTFLKGLRK